jgi:hypothetical protein
LKVVTRISRSPAFFFWAMALVFVLALAQLALVAPAFALSAGPSSGGAAGSAGGWTNASDAIGAVDGACARSTAAGTVLNVGAFGLAVPTDAEIKGVVVDVAVAAGGRDLKASLKKPDGTVGRTKALRSATTTCATAVVRTLGGQADRWGAPSLLPEDVNSAGFAVLINAGAGSTARFVDAVTVTVYYAPKAPTGVTATASSTSQIDLAWTDVTSLEDDFHLERCTGVGCQSWLEIATPAADATSYSDTGLIDNTMYRYRLRAHESATSFYSSYTPIAFTTTPPVAPAALAATTTGLSQVTLTWTDNSTLEPQFTIERCRGAGCSDFRSVAAAARNTTTYVDRGLEVETAYRYRLRAKGGARALYSSYSGIVSVTTGPAAPKSLSAASGGATQIDLNWTDASSIETEQRVERCSGLRCADFAEVAQLAASLTTYSDTGLTPDTLYSYRVRAYQLSTDLLSGYSNVISFTTPPEAPTGLAATATSPTQIALTWTDNSAIENHFHLERCAGAGCTSFAEVAAPAANAAGTTNAGLQENTIYRYRLRSHRHSSQLYSDYSAIATATTPLKAPTGLSATAANDALVNLAWTDVSTSESEYHVERCTTEDCTGFAEIGTMGAGSTSYADSGLAENTIYRYQIRAHNHDNSLYSSYSGIATVKTPLSAPTLLAAATPSATQVDLSWTDNSSVEDDFHIERCTGATCTSFAALTTVNTGTTMYSDTGLAVDTVYRYRVRAHEHTDGNYSAYASIVSATTAPNDPSALTATASSDLAIVLSWTDNSAVESDFHIESCDGAGCTDFAEIATVAANVRTYTDSGLSENTLYRYQVRAHAHGGNLYSGYSAIGSATTLLVAPSGLAATTIDHGEIDLTWDDNSTVESDYHIERCAGATCTSFVEITTAAANATALFSTGLTENTVYRYRVRAHEHAGGNYSSYSAIVFATTTPRAPSALTVAVATSSTQLVLSWTDNSSAESDFHLERCTGAGCSDFAEITSPAASSTGYTDTGLTETTVYLYRLRAHQHTSLLYSAYSATAAGVTLPATPTALAGTAAGATQIDLVWTDNSAGEDEFHIERCTGAGCAVFAEVATAAANAISSSDTGLTEGTTYRYRVRAHDHGNGLFSAYASIASATTAPSAPSGLGATAISSARIDLVWTDNSAIDEDVRVERCAGAACTSFVEVTAIATGTNTFSNVGLSADTLYRYRVRAHDDGTGLFSSYSGISEATTAPSAPSSLAAAAASATQVDLTWVDNSNIETGYRVERCSGVGCTNFAQIATPAADASSYSDTSTSADTLYRYRVRAFDAGSGLYSTYSDVASATTTPNAPSGLTATATSGTQINVSWTDNSSVESEFHVERCAGAGCAVFTDITQVAANGTTYTNNGLTADTSYTYQVRAHEHSGGLYSAYSATFTVVTQPAAPSGLTATTFSDTQIDLVWTDNSAVENDIHIERCTGAACSNFAEITTVAANTTTYSNTGLTAATLYRYRVRAHEHISGLYSSYSNVAEDTTAP